MISCNDGFRPVSFYIEVMDEDASSTSQLIIEFILANKLKINDTIVKYVRCGYNSQ